MNKDKNKDKIKRLRVCGKRIPEPAAFYVES